MDRVSGNLRSGGPEWVVGPDGSKEKAMGAFTEVAAAKVGSDISQGQPLSGVNFRDKLVVPFVAPPMGFVWMEPCDAIRRCLDFAGPQVEEIRGVFPSNESGGAVPSEETLLLATE